MTRPSEEHALERLVDQVVRDMSPLEIWLFGSRAEGRARADSDDDLLVVVRDDALEEWLDPMRTWQVGHAAGVIADIIPCSRAEFLEERHAVDALPRAAYHDGRRLYAA